MDDLDALHAESASEASPATDEPLEGLSLEDVRLEMWLRAAAIPLALGFAYIVMFSDMLQMLGRIFIGMWVHELGHATAAWLCGFWAFPGPWFTTVGEQRSLLFALLVTTVIVAIGFYGYIERRRALIALAAGLLFLQLVATLGTNEKTANMLITFFGDGGALVLGTLLMLTVYAPPGSKLHSGWLRWGFLFIGAVAFADVLHTWLPTRTNFGAIPFGRFEHGGLSDASVLVQVHGWDVRDLISRHIRLAFICGLCLSAAYVAGLLQARSAVRKLQALRGT